jgi:hypothetical protein
MTVKQKKCRKCGTLIRANGKLKYKIAKAEHVCKPRVLIPLVSERSNEIVIDIRINGESVRKMNVFPKTDSQIGRAWCRERVCVVV